MKVKSLSVLFCVLMASPVAAQDEGARAGAQGLSIGAAFDGVWTFASTTTSGSCPGLVPASVTIQAGHVIEANGGALSPWGYVESDGTFVARFTDANGHVSRASGTLRGAAGTGAWSSGTDFCGGAWRAQRGSGHAAR